MSEKTYLQEQIRLVSLSSYDLYTDDEMELFLQIIECKKKLDELDEKYSTEKDKNILKVKKQPILDEKKKIKEDLDVLISKHGDTPRTVRLKAVIYYPKDADYPFPEGVTYNSLKTNKKIAEFCCELSRAMGLKNLDRTLDLIVVKWKNTEILRQLVMNGFYIPILTDDGIENRHYHFYTASAGQLRRDKLMMISDVAWDKIKNRMECGLTWDLINKKNGCNSNKLSAYLALPNSATEEWTDFDIDQTVVIHDFKCLVTDRMTYIKPDYTWETGVNTVEINQTDGCGMMLPEVSTSNFMFRMPFCKGLLLSFDWLKFCKVNNAEPVVTDIWGKEWNLVKDNIKIILFESVVKMGKYYDSWEHYKREYKKNNCKCGKTNYEEDYIEDKTLNYQYIQTLYDVTDDEIKLLTKEDHDKILGITKNKQAMLDVLKADIESEQPYKAALALYPELLREVYSRESIKNIRKRMIYDARSGKLRCENKRLYASPDLYAVCQHVFLHEENPKGLLANGEIACKIFRRHDMADVLRSPHLGFDHAIRRICQNQNVYNWFYTNACYLSVHDLITRILQADFD